MHIAVLQFAPALGQVERNMARADELLAAAPTDGLDLLVLPELAFTGYNFPSLGAITPFLEPTGSGPTAQWAIRTARRLRCTVCVGYPERTVPDPALSTATPFSTSSTTTPTTTSTTTPTTTSTTTPTTTKPPSPPPPSPAVLLPLPTSPPNHNSLLLIPPTPPHPPTHYRKTHLYHTDTTWAAPSPTGFACVDLPLLSPSSASAPPTRTALGICMDLNPHRFLAPWPAFEFAAHARAHDARLVVLSMAWLTRLGSADVGWGGPDVAGVEGGGGGGGSGGGIGGGSGGGSGGGGNEGQPDAATRARRRRRREPDADTQAYWVARLEPLVRGREDVVVVCANRCGVEGGRGEGEACYAGSSVVLCVGGGRARVGGGLGRGEEGVLRVDTGAGFWRGGGRGRGEGGDWEACCQFG
ncbi:hypothetical protein MMC15_008005 [Xylographa vitiligo]|nr:hypothetical protein [Xylographa vitiligo]